MDTAVEVEQLEQAFRVRFPCELHAELWACSSETSLSMNELVLYAVEQIIFEARLDYEAFAQKVFARKAERCRKGEEAVLAGREP